MGWRCRRDTPPGPAKPSHYDLGHVLVQSRKAHSNRPAPRSCCKVPVQMRSRCTLRGPDPHAVCSGIPTWRRGEYTSDGRPGGPSAGGIRGDLSRRSRKRQKSSLAPHGTHVPGLLPLRCGSAAARAQCHRSGWHSAVATIPRAASTPQARRSTSRSSRRGLSRADPPAAHAPPDPFAKKRPSCPARSR